MDALSVLDVVTGVDGGDVAQLQSEVVSGDWGRKGSERWVNIGGEIDRRRAVRWGEWREGAGD